MRLTHEIAAYILEGFGINSNKKSIKTDEYKTSSVIKFEYKDNIIERNIYSIKSIADDREIKIYFLDISSSDVEEYAFIIGIDKLPIYGIYFYEEGDDIRSSICTSADKQNWLECNIFLQATFLAGMESIKELNFVWKWDKNDLSEQEKELVFSFIDHYNSHE